MSCTKRCLFRPTPPVLMNLFRLPKLQDWKEGRRVVDLRVLASQLEHCVQCSAPLRLSQCVGEFRMGLGGWLHIICDNSVCKRTNKVSLGTRHGPNQRIWDINTKLSTGMLHSGLGERQVNNLLTALNIRQKPSSRERKSLEARSRMWQNVVSGKLLLKKWKLLELIVRNFAYMCKQNKGKPELISASLEALSRHPFGDHASCSPGWCGYRFCTLCLTSDHLQTWGCSSDCATCLRATCCKLANMPSSQANESINNSIASKSPKTKCYSMSSSLNFRVGASVAHKN